MKKFSLIIILVLVFSLSLIGCTKTLDAQETNEVLTKALSDIDFNNMSQIDLSAQGNISLTETIGETTNTSNISVSFISQIVSKENLITSHNIQLKIDSKLSEDNINPMMHIESYYKNGTLYAYSNILGDLYEYQENYPAPSFDESLDENLPSDEINPTQIDAFVKTLTDGTFPTPEAKQKGDTITISWNLTIDDVKNIMLQSAKDMELQLKENFPDYELSTDEELMENIEANIDGLIINKLHYTITIVEEKLNNITMDMDIIQSETVDDTLKTSNVKANMSISIKTENVVVNFDDNRLEEIKTNYEKAQNTQQ